jgi:hypothetical protein
VCRGRGGGGRGGGEGSAGKGVAVEGGGGGRVCGGGGGRVWGKGAAQGLGLREERVEREGGVGEGGIDEVGLEGGRAVSMERGRAVSVKGGRAVSMKGGRAVTKFMGWGGADLVLGPDLVSTYEKMSIRFRPHHPHTSTLTDAQPTSHPFAPRQITVPQVYVNTDVQTYISVHIFARLRARAHARSLSLTHTCPRCCLLYLYDDATRPFALGQTQVSKAHHAR